MASDSGKKETPAPIDCKQPRKDFRGQRAEITLIRILRQVLRSDRYRFFAPTGLRHSAQGCEERATLGQHRVLISTPTGLHPRRLVMQPFQGWKYMVGRVPRVGAARQPWAECRKPFRLEPRLVAELHARFAEFAKLEQAINKNTADSTCA